jgi:hypothetical protein
VSALFADTFYWIALANPGDSHAQEVCGLTISFREAAFTRRKKFWEVRTFFAEDSWLRSRAVETVREILSDPAVHVIPQSHECFIAAFELYCARPDGRVQPCGLHFDADEPFLGHLTEFSPTTGIFERRKVSASFSATLDVDD